MFDSTERSSRRADIDLANVKIIKKYIIYSFGGVNLEDGPGVCYYTKLKLVLEHKIKPTWGITFGEYYPKVLDDIIEVQFPTIYGKQHCLHGIEEEGW